MDLPNVEALAFPGRRGQHQAPDPRSSEYSAIKRETSAWGTDTAANCSAAIAVNEPHALGQIIKFMQLVKVKISSSERAKIWNAPLHG